MTIKYFSSVMTPSQTTSFPYIPAVKSTCPLMILMNGSCELEGKPVSRNNYSRRWYLQSVLQ